MNLRNAARGQQCQIRLPGCLPGNETVVLAHFRDLSIGSGAGLKPSDLCAAWACDSCHSCVDGRRKGPYGSSRAELRLAHALGCLRTLVILEREGKLKVAA